MRTLAAIRTNKWGEDEERVLGQLRPAFGDDLVVVFHDRPADLGLPLAVVDLTRGWVARQGLGIVPDWGWRCGDYAHYAARAAFPGFDNNSWGDTGELAMSALVLWLVMRGGCGR